MRIAHDTLAGRFALVTGAGSGIGRATAKLLGHAGAKVALLGRSRDELQAVFDEMRGRDQHHRILLADVADAEAMTAALEQLAAQWPQLDIVVANAGVNGVWAALDHLTPEQWDHTLGINLRGTFLTVRQSLPLLRRRGGSVVIVSSVNGTRMFSNTGATAYACSKAAQVAFAKMTALELARDRIRVNVVCPGAISTEIEASTQRLDEPDDLRLPAEFPQGSVPLTGGGPGTAGQVAQLIWFLASDAASHITGTEIYIEGAESLLEG